MDFGHFYKEKFQSGSVLPETLFQRQFFKLTTLGTEDTEKRANYQLWISNYQL